LSLVKKDIVYNISNKAHLDFVSSQNLLQSFIEIIKKSPQKSNISNFGVFYRHQTSQRIGRNPKNKKEYIIKSENKLKFRASNNVKKFLN